MASKVSLFLLKIALSMLRLSFGPGNFPWTLAAVDIKSSNRPSSTWYDGPPAYKFKQT